MELLAKRDLAANVTKSTKKKIENRQSIAGISVL